MPIIPIDVSGGLNTSPQLEYDPESRGTQARQLDWLHPEGTALVATPGFSGYGRPGHFFHWQDQAQAGQRLYIRWYDGSQTRERTISDFSSALGLANDLKTNFLGGACWYHNNGSDTAPDAFYFLLPPSWIAISVRGAPLSVPLSTRLAYADVGSAADGDQLRLDNYTYTKGTGQGQWQTAAQLAALINAQAELAGKVHARVETNEPNRVYLDVQHTDRLIWCWGSSTASSYIEVTSSLEPLCWPNAWTKSAPRGVFCWEAADGSKQAIFAVFADTIFANTQQGSASSTLADVFVPAFNADTMLPMSVAGGKVRGCQLHNSVYVAVGAEGSGVYAYTPVTIDGSERHGFISINRQLQDHSPGRTYASHTNILRRHSGNTWLLYGSTPQRYVQWAVTTSGGCQARTSATFFPVELTCFGSEGKAELVGTIVDSSGASSPIDCTQELAEDLRTKAFALVLECYDMQLYQVECQFVTVSADATPVEAGTDVVRTPGLIGMVQENVAEAAATTRSLKAVKIIVRLRGRAAVDIPQNSIYGLVPLGLIDEAAKLQIASVGTETATGLRGPAVHWPEVDLTTRRSTRILRVEVPQPPQGQTLDIYARPVLEGGGYGAWRLIRHGVAQATSFVLNTDLGTFPVEEPPTQLPGMALTAESIASIPSLSRLALIDVKEIASGRRNRRRVVVSDVVDPNKPLAVRFTKYPTAGVPTPTADPTAEELGITLDLSSAGAATAVVEGANYVYVFTETNIFALQGKTPQEWQLSLVGSEIGCPSPWGAVAFQGGIAFWGTDGQVWLLAEGAEDEPPRLQPLGAQKDAPWFCPIKWEVNELLQQAGAFTLSRATAAQVGDYLVFSVDVDATQLGPDQAKTFAFDLRRGTWHRWPGVQVSHVPASTTRILAEKPHLSLVALSPYNDVTPDYPVIAAGPDRSVYGFERPGTATPIGRHYVVNTGAVRLAEPGRETRVRRIIADVKADPADNFDTLSAKLTTYRGAEERTYSTAEWTELGGREYRRLVFDVASDWCDRCKVELRRQNSTKPFSIQLICVETMGARRAPVGTV